MRLYVVYEPSGTITGISTHPEGAPEPVMELEPGEKDGFIDAPEIDAEASEDVQFAQIKELITRYRVEVESAQMRLSRNPERAE
ncbi:hypothetical protein ACFTWD_09430 [Streptomyces sp. NPDC056943]|uniref:hypothetical protein n=1 Tax=Streptomyces sp. NPDC056943 TaxID=3345971 RepID=UPI003633F52A